MPHCDAASAVTGPIDATTVVRSRSAAGSAEAASQCGIETTVMPTSYTIPAVEQHSVDVGFAFAFRFDGERAVRDHFGDVGALAPKRVGDQLAADVAARQKHLEA